MGSRGSKKKAVNNNRNVKIAERENERKKRERKLWWQMHKKVVIIVLCVAIALMGVVIGVSVKGCSNSDTGGTAGQYTLMGLGSKGCVPCDNLQPVLSSLRSKYSGKISVKFYDVNRTSQGAQLANKYNVSTIPTLIFLDKNGKVVKRMVGYQSQSEIESAFRSLGWI